MLKVPDSQKLADLFSAYPEIQAVYLFGSTLTGKTHAGSDLDLAVVPRRRGRPHPEIRYPGGFGAQRL